jgi:hypothetical protein
MTTITRISMWGTLAACLLLTGGATAAERREAPARPDAAKAVGDQGVLDLFEAIDAKQVEVKLIPKDATEARIFVTNKTKNPLSVRLPDAFAGVPVLAQRGGAGGGRTSGSSSSANQSFGGGMGGGMMGGGMMGGGMMNIPPEKVAKFKVPTVCLEHGKKDPRPGVAYEIKPLDAVTTKPGVKELLVAMSKSQVSQRAAQAAAWHLANEMSWQELAGKRIVHLNGTSELWFHPDEIRAGMHSAQSAAAQASKPEDGTRSPGETAAIETATKVAEE